MANYNRVTVWADGANLTASDLNAEFDAIKAVLNGGLERTNFVAGEVDKPIIINAGDERFQSGGLSNAELVEAAIAEAVAGNVKWVFIPRTMFGYASTTGYGAGIFDSNVALVKEGGPFHFHDPIAYGADPDNGAVDDAVAIQAALDGALDTDNPIRIVGFSVGGEYTIDTAITGDFPPVVYAATGLSGSADTTGTTTFDLTGDLSFAGSQVATWTPTLVPDAAPLGISSISTQTGTVGATTTVNTNAQILVGLEDEHTILTVMGRIRQNPGSFEKKWAHGVGSRVGDDDDLHLGTPSFILTLTGIYTLENVGNKQNFFLEFSVENTTAGSLDYEVEIVVVAQRIRRLLQSATP